MMLQLPNIKALGLVVSDKKVFKKGHMRIISAKFGQNPASSLGDVV